MKGFDIKKLENREFDLITVGEVLIDMISTEYCDGFECDTYNKYFGGSPANIAMNTKNLGINSGLITCVGRDSLGDFLVNEIEKRNIDSSYVERTDFPTSMVLLNKSKENPVPTFYRGADYKLIINKRIEDRIKNTKIVHFSSWPISKQPSRNTIEKIIDIAKENNTLIGFDPNYHPMLWDEEDGVSFIKKIIKKVDIIKPSEDDARRLFGDKTIDEYLQCFLELGAKLVVMTLGKDGLIATDGKEFIKLGTLADKVIDSTGAGDAFWSGLYTGIIKGYSIEDSVRLGSATSAYKLKYTGAVVPLPKLDDIKKMYNL
ncbi:MAG: carbohydrate kinase family protein [Clostridiaceae bacterium]